MKKLIFCLSFVSLAVFAQTGLDDLKSESCEITQKATSQKLFEVFEAQNLKSLSSQIDKAVGPHISYLDKLKVQDSMALSNYGEGKVLDKINQQTPPKLKGQSFQKEIIEIHRSENVKAIQDQKLRFAEKMALQGEGFGSLLVGTYPPIASYSLTGKSLSPKFRFSLESTIDSTKTTAELTPSQLSQKISGIDFSKFEDQKVKSIALELTKNYKTDISSYRFVINTEHMVADIPLSVFAKTYGLPWCKIPSHKDDNGTESTERSGLMEKENHNGHSSSKTKEKSNVIYGD